MNSGYIMRVLTDHKMAFNACYMCYCNRMYKQM